MESAKNFGNTPNFYPVRLNPFTHQPYTCVLCANKRESGARAKAEARSSVNLAGYKIKVPRQSRTTPAAGGYLIIITILEVLLGRLFKLKQCRPEDPK